MKKLLLSYLFIFCTLYSIAQPAAKPNIILIVMDDLNDYVQGYNGQPQVQTPNMYALEQKGTTFLNAYAPATMCAPSRSSFLTGKNPHYTEIFCNGNYIDTNFRANFVDGQFIVTLPQYLKDSGNYYTYNINKIFHADQLLSDYDKATADPCAKQLSWSKALSLNNGPGINYAGNNAGQDVEAFHWAKVDSAYVDVMQDYIATDSALQFLDDYAINPEMFCNKPFFLGLGYHKPHQDLYIPAQYFLPDYIDDFYALPFNLPFDTLGVYPYNGVVMPPQPAIPYDDFTHLGYMGQSIASPYIHASFYDWIGDLPTVPILNPAYDPLTRVTNLLYSKMANAIMAYLAAIKFIDEQIGRVYASLQAHPDILNNTIVIITSDHGYSLGEKEHWKKAGMWETDTRIPLIVVDFRNITNQTCNRTVGLIDLFPTLCDYAGINAPTFADGSGYLEGFSLLPLISNPTSYWQRPILTTVKSDPDEEGSCFEQFSIRDEKFHLIQYQSNNTPGILDCDEANSIFEYELYDIGTNREIDPNEWNNLADSADYTIIKNYLTQFLPDSNLYTQKIFTVHINSTFNECFLNNDDSIPLSFDLYNTTGALIALPPAYTAKWTNTTNADSYEGSNINFPLTIPELADGTDTSIYIYLSIIDTAGATVALDYKRFYLDALKEPEASFTASVDEKYITISDYTILGDYNYYTIDFGDGFSYAGAIPYTHHYADNGTYTLVNTIYFNDSTCVIQTSQTIVIDSVNTDTIINILAPDLDNEVFIFPNPASNYIIVAPATTQNEMVIELFDLNGKKVFEQNYDHIKEYEKIQVNCASLPEGLYVIKVHEENYNYIKQLVICRD